MIGAVEPLGRIAIDVDADEDVGVGRGLVERQRVDHAAIDQEVVGVAAPAGTARGWRSSRQWPRAAALDRTPPGARTGNRSRRHRAGS